MQKLTKGDRGFTVENGKLSRTNLPRVWAREVHQMREGGERVACGGVMSVDRAEFYTTLEAAGDQYETRLESYAKELAAELADVTAELARFRAEGTLAVVGQGRLDGPGRAPQSNRDTVRQGTL